MNDVKMKCECWHETPSRKWADAECWGTRERDACSCDGDQTKCDFYPEIREKARHIPDTKKPVPEWTLAECYKVCEDIRRTHPDECNKVCPLEEYMVCAYSWDLELKKKYTRTAINYYRRGINEGLFSSDALECAKVALEALEKMAGY